MDEDKSKYWLELAEYDLETAKAMQKTGRYLYVGFMCCLAAEKSLKALIARNGESPPKSHALIRLAELAGVAGMLDEDIKGLLNELSPLNVEARYPTHKEKLAVVLTERYCSELVDRTGGFLRWIERRL